VEVKCPWYMLHKAIYMSNKDLVHRECQNMLLRFYTIFIKLHLEHDILGLRRTIIPTTKPSFPNYEDVYQIDYGCDDTSFLLGCHNVSDRWATWFSHSTAGQFCCFFIEAKASAAFMLSFYRYSSTLDLKNITERKRKTTSTCNAKRGRVSKINLFYMSK